MFNNTITRSKLGQNVFYNYLNQLYLLNSGIEIKIEFKEFEKIYKMN